MGNGVRCIYCNKQETDHDENPNKLTRITAAEAGKLEDTSEHVCDTYTPDIKAGDEPCDCTRKNKNEWCDGHCTFPTRTSTSECYED